jgi:hypothetical protein
MKITIFIILLFVSTGLRAQSTWVKSGLYRSISNNALILGNNMVSCSQGINDVFGRVSYTKENQFLWQFRSQRVGIMFDISTLPDGITVDSLQIKLYSAGDYDVGVAISNRENIEFSVLSCGDDHIYSHPYATPASWACTTTSTSAGYNTYTLFNTTRNLFYGDNYLSFGIVEYQHDYSYVLPEYGEDDYVYFYLNTVDAKPELIIYYHTTPTPSPKKIKIIGVI